MEIITIAHSGKSLLIPIIYEFFKEAKKHIIIYDEAKKDEEYALELKKSIENLNKKYGINNKIEMLKIDEDNQEDMQTIAKIFAESSCELYLNGAGADSALLTVLSAIVLKNGGKALAYDAEDNSYNLISKDKFSNKKIKNSMNIEDYLILMGDELVSEINKKKIEKNKAYLLELFSDIKRVFKVRHLIKNKKLTELKKYKSEIVALEALGIVDKRGQLSGKDAYAKFGQLFEEYIFLRLEKLDFDDLKVGAIIRFDKKEAEKKKIEVQNEFDILLIKNNRLGFIECKFGSSFEPLGIIYKSDSIMEYFGENVSSMIVNMQRDNTPHLKNSTQNFSESVLLRAESKSVTVYNAFDFSETVFLARVCKAFGVELKDEFKKVNNKTLIAELQNSLEGI